MLSLHRTQPVRSLLRSFAARSTSVLPTRVPYVCRPPAPSESLPKGILPTLLQTFQAASAVLGQANLANILVYPKNFPIFFCSFSMRHFQRLLHSRDSFQTGIEFSLAGIIPWRQISWQGQGAASVLHLHGWGGMLWPNSRSQG